MKTLLLVAGIFFTALTQPAMAHVWRVNNVPEKKADFTSIAAAIAAAAPGDTLYIEPSRTNYGAVTLNKRLVVIGNGYFLAGNNLQANTDSTLLNSMTVDSSSVTANASSSTIIGIVFRTTVNMIHGVHDITFRHCLFLGELTVVNFAKPINNILISQCFLLRRFSSDGSPFPVTNVVIENNIFSDTAGQGLGSMLTTDQFSGIIRNNTFNTTTPGFNVSNFLFVNNVFTGPLTSTSSGTNCTYQFNTFASPSPDGIINGQDGNVTGVDMTTQFIGDFVHNYGDSYLQTTAASALRNSGQPVAGHTPDRGAYNTAAGFDSYQRSGLPPIPVISSLTVPGAVSPTATDMTIALNTHSASATTNITAAEWFIDNDPGLGMGQALTLTPGADVSIPAATISLTGITPGTHTFFARSKDINGVWSFTNNGTFKNDTPLPLTWLYVTATENDNQADISWGTAQETNTLKFEVERSTDGQHFASINSLPAAGNSEAARTYHCIDPTPRTGVNYYRIRQVDLDGKYTYSKVVTLLYHNTVTRTTATPNPTTGRITLLLAAPAQRLTATLYNAAGQPLRSIPVPDGATQQIVDLSACTPGIYFVQLQGKEHTEMIRVVRE